MNRFSFPRLAFRNAVPAVLLLAGLAGSAGLRAATGPGFRLEVLVNGRPAAEYAARGTRYIEAIEGAEYTLRLSNTTGRRIAVALAVDGLNTIDASHGNAREARKWVLGPYESAEISGWQVAGDRARAFYFTRETQSYGAWLGKTANLGNIEAVVFREKYIPPPPPIYYPQVTPQEQSRRDRAYADGRGNGPAAERGAAGEANGAYSSPETAAPPAAKDNKSGALSSQPAPDDEYAATGIGRDLYNPVDTVHMQLESRPTARVKLRYEYREQLIELGVFNRPHPRPRPLDRREQSHGFHPAWAPEPPRGW